MREGRMGMLKKDSDLLRCTVREPRFRDTYLTWWRINNHQCWACVRPRHLEITVALASAPTYPAL